jgi:hypothetical protein
MRIGMKQQGNSNDVPIEYYFHRDKIAKLSKRIRDLSRSKSYSAHFKRLVTCRGIGLITAMTFLLERKQR